MAVRRTDSPIMLMPYRKPVQPKHHAYADSILGVWPLWTAVLTGHVPKTDDPELPRATSYCVGMSDRTDSTGAADREREQYT